MSVFFAMIWCVYHYFPFYILSGFFIKIWSNTRQRTWRNPLLNLLFPPFCFSIWTVFNFFILNQSPTTPKSISTFFIFLYKPLQRLLNKNPSMTPSFLVFFYRTTAKHNSEKYSTPENIVIKILFSPTLVQHKKNGASANKERSHRCRIPFIYRSGRFLVEKIYCWWHFLSQTHKKFITFFSNIDILCTWKHENGVTWVRQHTEML